jgi:uncharacterized protein (DUF1810 family)
MIDDRFDLARFVTAQDSIYPQVLRELRQGAKQSHWMWFIFPQIVGLGHSSTARRYGISGRAEAKAYLAHTLLGSRLEDCTRAMLQHSDRSAHVILGTPDDLKFRSSMTLFAAVADSKKGSVFHQALSQFYEGQPDEATLARLD